MSIISTARNYFWDFVGLLFPKLCNACGNHLARTEDIICTTCLYELPKTQYHLNPVNPIVERLQGRVDIAGATALYFFHKGARVQQLLHHLKYQNQQEVGLMLGEVLGNDLKETSSWNTIDIVAPVPLHPKKLRERGFNQCDAFAEGLSNSMNIPWKPDALSRTQYTESQTQKNREERWQNVKGIFEVTDPESIKNKKILLVDDVITTGATLESCAHTLLAVEGVEVYIATIAMAEM